MITSNFKAVLALILQATSSSYLGLLPLKDVNGTTRYWNGSLSNGNFPFSITKSVVFGTGAGIHVGGGNTAASESDYTLESRITSGLSASSVTESRGLDNSGNPYSELLFTLTNTTNSDITVKEIGYVQAFKLADTQGGSSTSTTRQVLLDRTVLNTPVTVPANDSAAIKYMMKTIMPSS